MVKTADQMAQLAAENGLKVSDSIAMSLFPTPTTMEHREIKTPEQIAELKKRSPGGYANLRETVVNDLLPTPRAQEPGSTSVGYGDCLNDVANRLTKGFAPKDLLPTPAVGHIRNYDEPIEDYLGRRQDYLDGKTKGMPGVSLGVALRMQLLMTPVASEGIKAPAQQTSETKSKTGQVWLSNQAKDMEIGWGKFEPAIRRWEKIIDRPAPAPTKPDGKDGNHRLSAEFTEWMMGLPAGWVTDPEIGLTRNEQLKACGNGVVPQQAELALRILLQNIKLKGN
jgi:DNA (cytosine-5)-methyltransferase 1